MLVIFSCTKTKEKVSDDVAISVLIQYIATLILTDINTLKTFSIAIIFPC